MSAASNGQKPPEFMSTHPSDETRIKQLQEWMPEALKYYNKSQKKSGEKGAEQKKGKSNVVKIGG
jgi:predicted Zn-dependent protease